METNVWHTTPKIKYKKMFLHYKMNFETFNNLVLELTASFLNYVVKTLLGHNYILDRLWLLLSIDLFMYLLLHI